MKPLQQPKERTHLGSRQLSLPCHPSRIQLP